MCTLFVTSLDPKVAGNNQTIFGSQFFTNYFGVFVNDYNTSPVTQTAQLYTAQNALTTTLLSSTARTTGADVFIISFDLNVAISDYMPNVYLGAGENNLGPANQYPMLVSLLGNNTWVWSNNCTNSVPGATNSSCAAPPVSVSPLFD